MGGFKKTQGQVENPLDRRETPPDECNDTLTDTFNNPVETPKSGD